MQFALISAWDARAAQGDDTLRTCAEIGRIEGALAAAAARVLEMSMMR